MLPPKNIVKMVAGVLPIVVIKNSRIGLIFGLNDTKYVSASFGKPDKKRQEKQAILSVSLSTENRTFETSPLIQIYQLMVVQSIVLNSTPKPYPEKSPLGIAPTHQLF